MSELNRVMNVLSRIELQAFRTTFFFRVDQDGGRCFFQLFYTVSGQPFRGRKWWLSRYMTDDEIVKTAWLAFEVAVKHELLEGFRVDGQIVFNPHTPFDVLMTASKTTQFRTPE